MAVFFAGRNKITPWIEPAVMETLWEAHGRLQQQQPPQDNDNDRDPPPLHQRQCGGKHNRKNRNHRTKLAQITDLDLSHGTLRLSDGTSSILCYIVGCSTNSNSATTTSDDDDDNNINNNGDIPRRTTSTSVVVPPFAATLSVGVTVKVSNWYVSARYGKPCLLVPPFSSSTKEEGGGSGGGSSGNGGWTVCGGYGSGIAGNPCNVGGQSIALRRFVRTVGSVTYKTLLQCLEEEEKEDEEGRREVDIELGRNKCQHFPTGDVQALLLHRSPCPELDELLALPFVEHQVPQQAVANNAALPPPLSREMEEQQAEVESAMAARGNGDDNNTRGLPSPPGDVNSTGGGGSGGGGDNDAPRQQYRFAPVAVGYSLHGGRPIRTIDTVSDLHFWVGRVVQAAGVEPESDATRAAPHSRHGETGGAANVAFTDGPLQQQRAPSDTPVQRPPIPCGGEVMSDSDDDIVDDGLDPETQRPYATMGIGAFLVVDPMDVDHDEDSSSEPPPEPAFPTIADVPVAPTTAPTQTPPPGSSFVSARSSSSSMAQCQGTMQAHEQDEVAARGGMDEDFRLDDDDEDVDESDEGSNQDQDCWPLPSVAGGRRSGSADGGQRHELLWERWVRLAQQSPPPLPHKTAARPGRYLVGSGVLEFLREQSGEL